MDKSEYYQPARQYNVANIRCKKCQRQLGKEALKCGERPLNCPYDEFKFRSYGFKMLITQIIMGVCLTILGLAIMVQETIFHYLFGAFFLILGLIVFYELGKRLLRGFSHKGILDKQTGEKWQHLSGSETDYRPVAFLPDAVENPPKLRRFLSYPASSGALFDTVVYPVWRTNQQSIHAGQVGYVLLATLLHLVTLGYLEIWFASLYSSNKFGQELTRKPYHDFWFVLTDLGRSVQFEGEMEQAIKKCIKWHIGTFQNMKNWMPGAPLFSILGLLDTSGGDPEIDDRETLARKGRYSAFQKLLRDASTAGTVRKLKKEYQPDSEKEPFLHQDAENLAQLMQAYYDEDPQFTTYLWQQITSYLDSRSYEEFSNWLLKRESKLT